MSKPLIIEVAINEGTSRGENPTVPITPQEIAEDILACAEAGASIVHFHARDPETGANRLNDTDLYREAIGKVRAAGSDIHIYPTYPPSENDFGLRFKHVRELASEPELNVRLAPLDMGSFNLILFENGQFGATAFLPIEASVYLNPFGQLEEMLTYQREHNLVPTLAVFEPGHLRTIAAFMKQGLIQGTPMVKFFFSEIWLQGLLPDRDGVQGYVHILDATGIRNRVVWMCVSYGLTDEERELAVLDTAMDLGGHVRVGVGDNPATSKGRSNAELVAKMVGRAKARGLVPATPAEVLEMTGAR